MAIGAVLIFAASLGLLAYALYHPAISVPAVVFPSDLFGPKEETFARQLDGVSVSDASATSVRAVPYAVMVENSSEAWPLSGVADANLVFEAPVEGSITRFMLVFDPATTSSQIGPVRSARPYYVDWAEGLGAMYAHVGGSPDALAKLSRAASVTNLDQFYHGNDFWRSSSRYAPHNVYTSSDRLNEAAVREGVASGTSDFRSWNYVDEAPESSEISTGTIAIPYLGAYRASWEYDPETRLYTRWQNGRIQRDANGSIVTARNVVLLSSSASVLDHVGRLELQTVGSGDALVFHDGTVQRGMWRRSIGEHLRFETVDGRDMHFGRGKTWISILTSREAWE